MLPWYATREAVKAAPDIAETARSNAQVDRAVDSASRSVDGELRRRFYPEVATYTFPAPLCRTLFFDGVQADLVTLDTLTVDGTAVADADRDLLPVAGPPFSRIEFDDSVSYGPDRRPVSITGTWGYDDLTEPAGALAAAVADTTTTTVDVTDSAAVGVGDLLTIEAERVVVSAKGQLDTGQNLADSLDADFADTAVTVADGTGYAVGEVLLVDNEQLLVVAIAGNEVSVRRAFDGSTLAAHIVGADIFAPRRLTVERGALGTTAASHLTDTPVARQVYPGPVVAYTVALAEHLLLKEITGQGGEVGGRGTATVLDMAAAQARREYGRLLIA